MINNLSHFPVMVDEVLSYLKPKNSKLYLDGTFGQGGYSKKILESSNCKIFAIDRDIESQFYANQIKKEFKSRFIFHHEKLSNLNSLIKKEKIRYFDGIVLDLGISNTQLNNPLRGFSFDNDGPLDMRMDRKNEKLTAEIIINEYEEKELSDIFFYYGEERNSRKIAKSIINFRKNQRIRTTEMLSNIIKKINYSKFKHPATRVFQALRVFLNEELNELEKILELSIQIMSSGSRIVVVSFHSLEDRIIKNFFKRMSINKVQSKENNSKFSNLKIITKKPLTPTQTEIDINPRSRSAKMRVAEKNEIS